MRSGLVRCSSVMSESPPSPSANWFDSGATLPLGFRTATRATPPGRRSAATPPRTTRAWPCPCCRPSGGYVREAKAHRPILPARTATAEGGQTAPKRHAPASPIALSAPGGPSAARRSRSARRLRAPLRSDDRGGWHAPHLGSCLAYLLRTAAEIGVPREQAIEIIDRSVRGSGLIFPELEALKRQEAARAALKGHKRCCPPPTS